MTDYEKLTDILVSMKKITNQLESLWNKVDPITCEIIYEKLPMCHLPCDSCEEEEDA